MSMLSISNLRAGIIAACALVGPVALSAHAQDHSRLVRVSVPFDFESGSKHFKAGTYTIGSVNEHVALLRGPSTSGMTIIQQSEDGEPAEKGKVLFHKYADQYFMSDIFISGRTNHLHLVTSKDERRAEQTLRESHRRAGTIALLEWPD